MLTIRIYMECLYKQDYIKNKSHIYIMFQRYIYNYVHFRLRCLDSVFHSEQQRQQLFVFFQNKVRLQGIMADSF